MLEKDSVSSSVSKLSKIEQVDEKEELWFIADDVLKWRWLEEDQSSSVSAEA